jgi:hypothetical protein
MIRLLPIVEGHGDLEAVPLLVRRVLHELHGRFDVEVLSAQRRGEWPRVKQDFERFFRSARLENAPILWVLDFDCADCIDHEKERGWGLAEAARLDPTGLVEIVFLVKEFESLFLWEARPLRDGFGEQIGDDALPAAPEEVRDAKGFVSNLLPKGRAYKPTTDQARIAQRLDLQVLQRRSPSFQRFESAIRALS